MKLKFFKMQGCGNDFIFHDSLESTSDVAFTPLEIRFLCDRHFGPGADGVVVLRRSTVAHAAWDFYNQDASEAEMCGNAARCAIKYLHTRHVQSEEIVSIETLAGVIKGKVVSSACVEVTLLSEPAQGFGYEEKVLKLEDQAFQIFCINTGVPHAVIEVKDLDSYRVEDVGRQLINHSAFGEEGTNVTFFQAQVGNRIRSTTFERGVERQTFACGTGAAAAAIIYSEQYLQPLPVEVTVPGGELTVGLSPISRKLLLQGPAEFVMQFELENFPRKYSSPRLFGRNNKP